MKKQPWTPTPEQHRCIDALEHFALGRHHCNPIREFGSGVCMQWYGDLSTHDGDKLTFLVLVAHQHAVRFEIAQGGPKAVKIIAHARQHGDRKEMRFWQWHPSIDDLSERLLAFKAKGGEA